MIRFLSAIKSEFQFNLETRNSSIARNMMMVHLHKIKENNEHTQETIYTVEKRKQHNGKWEYIQQSRLAKQLRWSGD